MKTLQSLGLWGLSMMVMHCGATVTAGDTRADAATAADATPATDAGTVSVPGPTPACDVVRAGCTGEMAQVVRGHAEGLTGVDGARAEFFVRYRREGGPGDVSEVALGRTTVRGGSFETCVCVPYGADAYPSVGAVVFRTGATGETSRDVARALHSQRYATLGDEDFTMVLPERPTAPMVEAALAARDTRSRTLDLLALDPSLEGASVFAGIVSAERPIAAQLAQGTVAARSVALRWGLPGRAWPNERVVVLIDRNHDRRCDASDVVAFAPLGDASSLSASRLTLASGSAQTDLCVALSVDQARE